MANIVTALFNSTGRARTRPLYRYDYGQVLQISGATLPETYEVHFSNSVRDEAVTVTGNANGVEIPDACLIDGRPVYAWLYMHTGEDDGETVFHITIPVIDRSCPSGQAPTPVKHDLFQEAMDAVAEATEEIATATEAMNAHFPATGKFVAGTGSTTANYAAATGNDTVASGYASHAEGHHTTASGDGAHAEGQAKMAASLVAKRLTASGAGSHAEGIGTTASSNAAHAEGMETVASGRYSHSEGQMTVAAGRSQHVFGEYNQSDASEYQSDRAEYVEIVGNGTSDNARSNARTLDWNGNETLAGGLEVANGVKIKNIYLANNVGNEPRTLVFYDCDKIKLSYEEDLGEVVAEHVASISLGQLNSLLSMLQYYQSITPFTASEISALRALISGGGQTSGAGDVEEPVTEEPVSEEPVTEEPVAEDP